MGGGEEEGLVKVSIRSRQGLDKVSIRVETKGGKFQGTIEDATFVKAGYGRAW